MMNGGFTAADPSDPERLTYSINELLRRLRTLFFGKRIREYQLTDFDSDLQFEMWIRGAFLPVGDCRITDPGLNQPASGDACRCSALAPLGRATTRRCVGSER